MAAGCQVSDVGGRSGQPTADIRQPASRILAPQSCLLNSFVYTRRRTIHPRWMEEKGRCMAGEPLDQGPPAAPAQPVVIRQGRGCFATLVGSALVIVVSALLGAAL